MAKLVLVKENGEEVLIREHLPENAAGSDFMYKEDYIAAKLWMEEDVYTECIYTSEDLFPSMALIKEASNCIKQNELLNECTDSDWEMIRYALRESKIEKPAVIEDFAKPDEYIVRLVLEGDYTERYIISEDKDISDLGASIESTLYRIIDVCENYYDISEEETDEMVNILMGVSKDEELPISIDLGWSMPSILSCEVLPHE